MDNQTIFNLIISRRTCFKFLDKSTRPVSETAITQCLEASITAPNHKMTQPWLFYDLGLESQPLFANIYADNRAGKKYKTGSNAFNDAYDKALLKFNAFPKIILVAQLLADDKITRKEDYAACACAIQNFQLMAWQQKIGMQWSTGPIINDDRTYQLLNIDKSNIEIIGALYIGNIDENCLPNDLIRKPLEDSLTRLD